jgi:hypothetical protein
MRVGIYILLGVIFFSCSEKKITFQETREIDLSSLQMVSENLFFDKLELIPLETTSQSLIRRIDKIEVSNGMYYILDYRRSCVLAFDMNGKFLFVIDEKGKAPGQYLTVSDFSYNKNTDKIEILSGMNSELFIYNSTNGHFVESFKLPLLKDAAYMKFRYLSEDLICFWTSDEEHRLYVYSRSKNKILAKFYKEDSLDKFCSNCFSVSGHLVRGLQWSIWRIKPNDLQFAYRWSFKGLDEKLDKKELMQWVIKPREYGRKIYASELADIVLYKQFENKKYGYVEAYRKNDCYQVMYDKKTKLTYTLKDWKNETTLSPLYMDENCILCVTEEDKLSHSLLEGEISLEKNEKVWREHRSEDNPVLLKYSFKHEK